MNPVAASVKQAELRLVDFWEYSGGFEGTCVLGSFNLRNSIYRLHQTPVRQSS